MMDWVVTFDVPDDRDRSVVHRSVERFGHRVLHSVYELDASAVRLGAVLHSCADRVDGGHLLALPWCASCRVVIFGDAREVPPDGLRAAW